MGPYSPVHPLLQDECFRGVGDGDRVRRPHLPCTSLYLLIQKPLFARPVLGYRGNNIGYIKCKFGGIRSPPNDATV